MGFSGQQGRGRKGTYVTLGEHLAWVPKMEFIFVCPCCWLHVGPSPMRIGGISTEMPKSWAWPRPVKFPKKLVGTFQSKLYSTIALPYSSPLFDQPMKTAKAGASLKSVCVMFIWCVYMLYKVLKIKSQGVVSRYKFHPQMWGNCMASIQSHNKCLLWAKGDLPGLPSKVIISPQFPGPHPPSTIHQQLQDNHQRQRGLGKFGSEKAKGMRE